MVRSYRKELTFRLLTYVEGCGQYYILSIGMFHHSMCIIILMKGGPYIDVVIDQITDQLLIFVIDECVYRLYCMWL